nr:Gag-Pol polyprotein [Tanacetum cinerariifolium]
MQEEVESLHMEKCGNWCHYLGMQIYRDRVSRNFLLSQKSDVKKILQRFNIQDCKQISTPFPTNIKLSKMSPSSEKERMEISRVPYASALGSLMFTMICTRPDLANRVRVVIRYMVEPGREHWEAMKRILRYIKGTSDVALCFAKSDLIVKGYVHLDYAGDSHRSRSTTRYGFTHCGRTVRWVSKLHMIEDVAGRTRTQTRERRRRNRVYPTFHAKTNHIRVQYHFVHKKEEEETVDM